ncbi:unnamed protein product [Cunninghamella blakesleeana]
MVNLEEYLNDLGLGIKGRSLVALRPLPAGTVVLEQLPLTQVPLPFVRRQRCNYCLRRASLQCCGRCRSAYFCSNTCFRNAWLHYHHVLCEPLEYDTYTNVNADCWLLERAALTLHSHARLNKHNSHSPPHLKYAIQALELHPQPNNHINNNNNVTIASTINNTNANVNNTNSINNNNNSNNNNNNNNNHHPNNNSHTHISLKKENEEDQNNLNLNTNTNNNNNNNNDSNNNNSINNDENNVEKNKTINNATTQWKASLKELNINIPPTITPGATITSSSSVPIDFEAVSQMLAPFDCPFSADELYTVQQQIEVSRFDILDTDQHMEKVGYGVYPLTTLYIQHSCRPNTGIVYRQDKQRIVALKDIAVGETINISYVDLTLPRGARMIELQRRFGVAEYNCQCERCYGEFACLDELLERGQKSGLRIDQATTILEEDLANWNTLDVVQYLASSDFDGTIPIDAKLFPSEFSHYAAKIISPDLYIEGAMDVHVGSSSSQSPSLSTFLQLGISSFDNYAAYAKESRIKFVQNIPILMSKLLTLNDIPVFTVNMIRAAELLLRNYMDHQKWLEAARCATFLFIIYRIVYPPLHPVCSFHTIVLAKASWNSLIQLELQSSSTSSSSSSSSSNLNNLDLKVEKLYYQGIRTWIDISRDATLLTFGQDSTLWREVVDLQWIFERDQKLR